MTKKLKYINLFESVGYKKIPGMKNGTIIIPKRIPAIYNELTNEVVVNIELIHNNSINVLNTFNNLNNNSLTDIEIRYNDNLKVIDSFNSVTKIEKLYIQNNNKLTDILGFENLKKCRHFYIQNNESLNTINAFHNFNSNNVSIKINNNPNLTSIIGFGMESSYYSLTISDNPKFILMSLPKKLLKSLSIYSSNYKLALNIVDNYSEGLFVSLQDFINSPVTIDDLVTKFNPDIHGDQVVKQILENLEEWGTLETKDKVIPHLISKLPGDRVHIFPDNFKHLYHPDYQGTSVRDVAKFNSGQIYGIF